MLGLVNCNNYILIIQTASAAVAEVCTDAFTKRIASDFCCLNEKKEYEKLRFVSKKLKYHKK